MTTQRKPIIHARDHEHGGADPVHVAWEDVGTGGGGGGGGGGIQFDTYPQDGGWLYVETTDSTGSPNGYGQEFVDLAGNGIAFNSVLFSAGDIYEDTNGAKLQIRGNGIRLEVTGSQFFDVCMGYNGTRAIRAENVSGTPKLAFFGVTAVARPSTPTTLSDVITALQTLGLVT